MMNNLSIEHLSIHLMAQNKLDKNDLIYQKIEESFVTSNVLNKHFDTLYEFIHTRYRTILDDSA